MCKTCKILRSLINSLEYDQPTRANDWRVAKASRRLLFHSLFAAAAGSRERALSLASEVREHVDAKSGCRCGRASCSSLAITQIGSMISCFLFYFLLLLPSRLFFSFFFSSAKRRSFDRASVDLVILFPLLRLFRRPFSVASRSGFRSQVRRPILDETFKSPARLRLQLCLILQHRRGKIRVVGCIHSQGGDAFVVPLVLR